MSQFLVGSYVRPCDGEAVSGDAIVVKELPAGIFMSLIDVLGHGRDAAEVALQAIRYLKQHASPHVADVLVGLHHHLEGTRGAAACVAFANPQDATVVCTGMGNVMLRMLGIRERLYPFPDGTIGLRLRTPKVYQLSLPADELLLIYSDGITEGFPLPLTGPDYSLPLQTVARRIVLDHGKLYDDAACIALRYQP